MAESEEQVSPCRPATPGPVQGKALVKGLCDNQRLQWEVSFELEPPALQREDEQDADMWSETFHHLAARAIIRDFEQLAEREDEIELGEHPGLRRGPVFPTRSQRFRIAEPHPFTTQGPPHPFPKPRPQPKACPLTASIHQPPKIPLLSLQRSAHTPKPSKPLL